MTVKTEPMAKRRATEKTETIRVTERVARMLGVICLAEDTNTSEVVTPILEKALKQRYLQALAKLQKEPEDMGIQ
jgi:hypothetical protein